MTGTQAMEGNLRKIRLPKSRKTRRNDLPLTQYNKAGIRLSCARPAKLRLFLTLSGVWKRQQTVYPSEAAAGCHQSRGW
jgi:hypothetical protein